MLHLRLRPSLLLIAVFCCMQTQAVNVESCEGQSAQLDCGVSLIKLIGANYGRRNNQTCSAERPVSQVTKTDCILSSSLSQVAKRCEGQSKCLVPATNTEFTDPCVGTFKYLEVLYTCIAPPKAKEPIQQYIGCEGCVTHLECRSGVININSAIYGRRDPNTCSLERPGSQLQNVACSIANYGTIQNLCNGRKMCEFRVTNALFGDPCVGTYKYLEVLYSCVG